MGCVMCLCRQRGAVCRFDLSGSCRLDVWFRLDLMKVHWGYLDSSRVTLGLPLHLLLEALNQAMAL